jgi:hypothetical protein
MDISEFFLRFWEDLLARPSGPLALRFILQPAMSAVFAVRDGLKDARDGRSPYFWTVLTDPAERTERLKEGVSATAKIMILAVILDTVYQFRVFDAFYPGETIVIALVLAFIPYLLIRGPVARIARHWIGVRSVERSKAP